MAKGDLGSQENFSVIFQEVFNCLSIGFQHIISGHKAEKGERKFCVLSKKEKKIVVL